MPLAGLPADADSLFDNVVDGERGQVAIGKEGNDRTPILALVLGRLLNEKVLRGAPQQRCVKVFR